MDGTEIRMGTWARAGDMVGVVAALDGDSVTVFSPGDRKVATVSRSELVLVPAGAVTVTLQVDVPLPHGLGEEAVRRWIASLADPVLRERAAAALSEAGLDDGAALPQVRANVAPAAASGAVCLCGARTPAPPGTIVACARCGRQAASRPADSGGISMG